MELDLPKAWAFSVMSLKVDLSSLSVYGRTGHGVAKHRARVSGRDWEESGAEWQGRRRGKDSILLQESHKSFPCLAESLPHRSLRSRRNLKDWGKLVLSEDSVLLPTLYISLDTYRVTFVITNTAFTSSDC